MYVHVYPPTRSFLKVGDLKYEYSQAFLHDTDLPTISFNSRKYITLIIYAC